MSGGWAGSTRAARLPKDWPKRRATVLKRDPLCYICKRAPATEVDHKNPGDDHSLGNLGGACSPCHKRKTQREAALARHRFKKERKTEKHPGLI